MTQIAKVAVAAATYAIDKPYDYLVPSGMELSVGCRVTVPFGRGNRTAEGMVLQLRQEVPAKPLKAIRKANDLTAYEAAAKEILRNCPMK